MLGLVHDRLGERDRIGVQGQVRESWSFAVACGQVHSRVGTRRGSAAASTPGSRNQLGRPIRISSIASCSAATHSPDGPIAEIDAVPGFVGVFLEHRQRVRVDRERWSRPTPSG